MHIDSIANNNRLALTLQAFDDLNKDDPNMEMVDGKPYPKELIYGHRMSARLQTFHPDASEYVQLAVRAQHLCRWKIARNDYPMDKHGYKSWRMDLAKLHGQLATDIMTKHGYSDEETKRVSELLLKKNLKRNDETQTLEDVACLVFLEFHLDDFAAKHDDNKLIDIIRKTWNKMSTQGHEAALKLTYSPKSLQLIQRALSTH
jgi:hypothetical protein